MDQGYKRLLAVWHRRAGKDKTLINIVAKEMLRKVGTYYYFLPTYNQGSKIIWNGMDKQAFKFLNHIPEALRKKTNGSNMMIELVNGSIFQVIGTDNVDSIVGTNPIGCIFSEYSLQNPIAWGYIRPILAENGGWAIFNFTSRGRNHAYDLVEYAKKNPDEWFVQILTADDTDVFTPEQLKKEEEQYILEDGDNLRFMQEYYCSFEGSIQGSYYGRQMADASKQGRIRKVMYDSALLVDTYWDLGIGDAMSVWFVQQLGNEIRLIDYIEKNGEGLDYFAAELKAKNYRYGKHFAPHDIVVRELSSGKSRLDAARLLGINFEVISDGDKVKSAVPNLPVIDGIQNVRLILNRCYFDEEKCEQGINALRYYHKKWDDKRKCYTNSAEHDWSSHGADSFRYLAVTIEEVKKEGTLSSITKLKPKI